MYSLNKAQIIGNLTRDPELKELGTGTKMCVVGVATNRYWTDSNGEKKDEAEFHSVVCWGKLAEIVVEYLKKGDKVFFEGRLQTRTWEDDAGIKHYKTEIVGNDMIILSGRKGNTGEKFSDDSMKSSDSSKDMKENINLDDLPF